MAGGMSQCSRNERMAEFQFTNMRNLPSTPKLTRERPVTPHHVNLTQASRPSTTSAYGAFAGNLITFPSDRSV